MKQEKNLDEFFGKKIQLETNSWIVQSEDRHRSERMTPEDSEIIHGGGN